MKVIDIANYHQKLIAAHLPVDFSVLTKKVEDEVHIMTMVKGHPNIVELLSAFKISNHIFISMELFDGVDLLNIIKEPGLPEFKAKHLYRQIMKGIHYCRTRNVVHGDVKLENILLSRKGRIKLIDFGFSHYIIGGQKPEVFSLFHV